jgi:hypothetical protein
MLNKTFHLLLLLLIPLLCFSQANSQYPDSGNKIRLGFQTTADGLIWRDTQPNVGVYQPINNKAAWVVLDTVNNKLYHYKNSAWTLVGGDTTSLSNRIDLRLEIADTTNMLSPYWRSGRFSGVLPVANGGTGSTTQNFVDLTNTQTVNGEKTLTSNLILKNSQEPARSTFLSSQTFGADTTNWTRGTGWTFNGTLAVATAATGNLTYTTLPDTIISGRAYEITYTQSGYISGTATIALGDVTLAIPQYDVTANIILLLPTSATGGFRITTSTYTGNLDNISIVEITGTAPVIFAGQDDAAATLYNSLRMPNSTTLAFGGGGGRTTGIRNNFFGLNAGQNNTTGANNNFFGVNTGSNNSTGSNNNFIGSNAGLANTIGNHNNFFGSSAGGANTTGVSNNFFGNNAGDVNTIGNNNNFFGSNAGGANTTGSDNVFIGESAGLLNTTGVRNNFIGINAGRNNTTGGSNFFFGQSAGRSNTTGSSNVGLGDFTFNQSGTTTGDNNTLIGVNAGDNITGSAAGNLVLGNAADLPDAGGSNQVVIKNIIFATGASGTGTTIAGNVGIAVNTPTARLHLIAGSATASTAPLKFTSGTNLTTAELGAMEFSLFNGANRLFITPESGVRKEIGYADLSNVSGVLPVANGGTNRTTMPAGYILHGDGTSVDTAIGLFWDRSLRFLGVGTSSPALDITINSSSSVPGMAFTQSYTNTSAQRGGFYWLNNANSTVAAIIGQAQGDNVGTGLEFTTRPVAGSATVNMVLRETGRLGIGTPSPTEILHVVGNGLFTGSVTANDNIAVTGASKQIRLENSSFVNFTNSGNTIQRGYIQHDGSNLNIASSVGSITLINALTGTSATFSSSITSNSGDIFATDGTRTNFFGVGTSANVGYLGTTTNHDLAFLTNNTEKMRLTKTGNVGIGTNDPQSVLNSFSSAARGLAIYNGYPFIGLNDTDGGNFYIGTQANLAYVWNGGSDAMIFATNNAERMRITSGGNVLIGGTQHDYGKLDVTVSPSSYTAALGLGLQTNSGEGNSVGISFKTKVSLSSTIWENARIAAFTDAISSSAYGALAFYTMSATTLLERMRIGNNGFVGIGTASPAAILDVRSTMRVSGDVNFGSSANDVTLSSIVYTNGTGGIDVKSYAKLGLYSAGTERIHITTGGNVGISRTPTTNALEVNGDASKTTVGSWAANSDSTIKTEIHTIDSALDRINKVRLVSFKYKDNYKLLNPSIKDKFYQNVIAQEFQKIYPDYVYESGDIFEGKNILQVDTNPMYIDAVASIQELSILVKELSAQVDILKQEIINLKNK